MSDGLQVLRQAREIACRFSCWCYDIDSLEYDPAGPCPRCQLIALLDELLAGVGVDG